jgi:two-component system response regulator HydG
VKQVILVVDDHPEMVALLCDQLREEGYETYGTTEPAQALQRVGQGSIDLLLTDLRMGELDGLDLLIAARQIDPLLPIIVMTAFGAVETAVEAMRRGASHYLTKPYRTDDLLIHVHRALEERGLRGENRALRSRLWDGDGPEDLVGSSRVMQLVYERVSRVADVDVPVLVRGESGTGKERIARAVHFGGKRRSAPFVPLNCASIPASLLESELFGHARGAFTGASGSRRGLFLEASGGTLFLDEIGDMPLELQAHLLRVLEDKQVRPVGADKSREVDVRIVAATHQRLESLIEAGRFRADLFYRLDVVPIDVPPLRERKEDIAALLDTFLRRQPGPVRRVTPAALALLEGYSWPGNVRELENLVRRLQILVDTETADTEQWLAIAPQLATAVPTRTSFSEIVPLRQLEDEYLAWVLERCDGNKTHAAELLGIDVSTIHRRFRALGR